MRSLAVVWGVALAACHDGRVVLELQLPERAELDPLRDADTLTLDVLRGGETVHSATIEVPARGAGLDFGDIPVGEGVQFEVRASTEAGRVVGFGRSVEAIEVSDDDEVRVPIVMRRAFAYLSGGDALVAIDASRGPGDDYVSMIDVGAPLLAVAAAGATELVVASASSVRLVSTSTHAVLPGEVPLLTVPHELAVSPDGRWAAISHRENLDGVSIVDLAALRAGAPVAPVFVEISRPGSVAIAGDVLWVLVNPVDSLSCSGTSSVVSMRVDAAAPAEVPLNGRASHLTADPGSGAAIVSVGCRDEVVAIDAPGAAPRLVYAGAGVGAATVARGRLWLTGTVGGVDAHLTLTDVGLDGSAPHTLDLPTTEERAVAVALEEAGQDGQIRLTADLHTAFAISALPDAAHVAIVDIAAYIGEASGDAGGGRPIVPEMQMITREYQLVQLDTGLAAQRLRLSCEITWQPGALLDDFRCARAPGQDEAPVPFAATDLSVVYGSR